MSRWTRIVITAALVTLTTQSAWAFNARGHKVVAAIAWEKLSPSARTNVVQALRKHPRFAEDFAGPMNQQLGSGASQNEQDRWIFCQAAIWPDIARGFTGSTLAKYHRPRWHYINLPVFLDSAQADHFASGISANVSFDYPSSLASKDYNVVQAIKYGVAVTSSATASEADKAVHYCWLLHDIADLHQPAHSAALFTVVLFENGDKGANAIEVRLPSGGHKNLHSVWDGLLGTGNSFNDALGKAAGLIAAHPADYTAPIGSMPHDAWATETQQLALQQVYGPILAELRAAEASGELDEIDLSEEYMTDSGEIAGRQGVIAGVRLAKVLTSIAQPGPTPVASASRELGFPAAIAQTSTARAGRAAASASARVSRGHDASVEDRLTRIEAQLADLQSQLATLIHDETPPSARARRLKQKAESVADDGEQCTCGAEETEAE